MNILDFLFSRDSERDAQRALSSARRQAPEVELPADIAAKLDGGRPFMFGRLASGEPLRIAEERVDVSAALLGGATGAGKTTMFRALLRQKIDRGIRALDAGEPLGFELELVDGKRELSELTKLELAAAFVRGSNRVRDALPHLVRVDGFNAGRVTPFCPYAVPKGLSPAFVGFSRAELSAQVRGGVPEQTKRILQMTGWLLAEKGHPPHPRFALRFFGSEDYREGALDGLPEELREYFAHLRNFASQASIEAAVRHLIPPSVPEYTLATLVPPAEVDRLGIVTDAPIRIGGYASATIPNEVVMERAGWHMSDALRSTATRTGGAWRTIVFDEVLRLLSSCPAIAEPIADGVRTFRTARAGVVLIAQEFTGTLPPRLLAALTTNAGWMVGFQSAADAPMYFPHVSETGGSHAERSRAFMREFANLPPRHYKLRVRGYPVLSAVAPEVRPVSVIAGMTDERLMDVFEREIAPASTLDPKTAQDAIERWEAAVLPDTPPKATKRARTGRKAKYGSFSDLMDDVAGGANGGR